MTTQIGTVILFGFLIVTLSLYQANVVPAQNSQVEFNHYQRIQGDMHDLRSAILDAAVTNKQQTTTLELGTRYSPRVLTMNAPHPSGHVEATTIGTGRITLSDVNLTAICGLDQTTTKAIEYTPRYHYLQNTPSITYENSVLYRQTADGTVLVGSEPTLISDRTINLIPLRSNVSTSQIGTVSLDFQGSQTGETQASKPLTLTIPTRLSSTTWENRLLADEPGVKQVVQNTSRPSAVDIELERDMYSIRCTTTGTGAQPNVSIAEQGEEKDINPGELGGILLESESRGQNQEDNVVTLSLNNTAGVDRTIQEVRINFYHDVNDQGNPPAYANITNSADTVVTTLNFREDFTKSVPELVLSGNGTVTPVKLKFYADSGTDAGIDSSDWFVVTFHFSESESATYFVPVPK